VTGLPRRNGRDPGRPRTVTSSQPGGPAVPHLSVGPVAEKTEKKPHDPTKWLRRSRSVLLYGPVEPKMTKEVTQQLIFLDALSATKPIKVFVNSPGGVADDGFAIYDLLRFVRAPVYTIVAGMAASAATILLLGA